MSTVAEDVRQIRNAIYGREVREAIADGIEHCYSDVSGGVTTATTAANAANAAAQRANTAAAGAEGIPGTASLEDIVNITSALTNQESPIDWKYGNYGTTDGTYSETDRYKCTTKRFQRAYFPYLVGWNINDLYSWVSLYQGDTYIGYYHAANPSTIERTDWDCFALNVYLESSGYLIDDIHFVSPFILDSDLDDVRNLVEFSFSDTSSVIRWLTGFYDPSTGALDTTSSTQYRCSVSFYERDLLPLLTGFDYSSTYDYIALYKGSSFVTIVNSGAQIPKFGWDRFTITVYLGSSGGTQYHSNGLSDIYFRSLMPRTNYGKRIIEVSSASQLVQAVQTAIDHENSGYYYDIILNSGTYELWPVLDKSVISGSGDQLYHRGLELPDRCNLIGRGDVSISCTIPESDNSAEHPYTLIVSTLNLHNTENLLENIRFIGRNTRYCIHDDSGFDDHYKQLIVRNCEFVHSGTDSDTYMPSPRCYGAGFTSGRKAVFENCVFSSSGSCDNELYVHTHNDTYCDTDLELIVDSCAFLSINKVAIDYQVVDNSSYGGRVTIRNCYFASGNQITFRGQNPSNTRVFGGGNGQATIDNQISANIYLT